MKKFLFAFSTFAAVLAPLSAQNFVLDNFNLGSQSGAVVATSTWNNNTSLTTVPGALTVGGSATDQSGWEYINPSLIDLSAYAGAFLELTAMRGAGNGTADIFVNFGDDNGAFQTFTFSTSAFAVDAMTTVRIPATWLIDSSVIFTWNIGGGNPAADGSAFAMSFDNLALTTATAVPEPSTYAAIFGVMVLGGAMYRRRQRRLAA